MSQRCDYGVVRERGDLYRLDRLTPPFPGPAAYVARVTDRYDNALGWRLKPLVTMQGSRSRLWESPARAIAATLLMTERQAAKAVLAADNHRGEGGRDCAR